MGNPQDAEDLTAATFGKSLESLARYEERGSFAAWLFSIARHSLLDHRRRHRAQVDVARIAPTLPDPEPGTEARLIEVEQAQELYRLIDALPPDQRDVVLLRFFGRLRSAEVGQVLGRNEGAVRMLLHRALRRLRRAYDREEER